MECRSSGLSDQQWCREKGIEPSIFYNWVSRLRKQGTYDIPEPCHAGELTPAPVQDVVKLDIFPEKSYDFPSPQHQNQNNRIIHRHFDGSKNPINSLFQAVFDRISIAKKKENCSSGRRSDC